MMVQWVSMAVCVNDSMAAVNYQDWADEHAPYVNLFKFSKY